MGHFIPRVTAIENRDLFIDWADCGLKCCFCEHGLRKRLRDESWLSTAAHALGGLLSAPWRSPGRLLRQLDKALEAGASGKDDRVCLSGWDILEHKSLFDILDLCRKRGRRIQLMTPGLKLADRAFAERLSKYKPSVTVTYLTRDPAAYARLTGVPDAHRLAEAALSNLRELKIGFFVNFVATSKNRAHLAGAAEHLFDSVGLTHLTVLYFSPERDHFALDPGIGSLLFSQTLLNPELRRIAERYAGKPHRVNLWRVPPCKIEKKLLTCGSVAFSVSHGPDAKYEPWEHPNCSSCGWKPRCPLVSRFYHERFPDEEFDAGKVNSVLEKICT